MPPRPAKGHQSAAAGRDWISRLLSNIAYRAALRPKRTLVAALALTAVAACLAVTRLEFRTSRLDLLSDSAGYNQRWLDYLAKFGHDDDAVVVVSHSDPERVAEVLTSVGRRLESEPLLSGVLYRKSVGQVADKALHLMPATELEQLDQLLLACLGLLSPGAHVPATLARAQASPAGADVALQMGSLQAGSRHAASYEAATAQAGASVAAALQPLAEAIAQAQMGLQRLREAVPKEGPLLLEDQGKLGICLVRLPHVDDEPVEAQNLLACLHGHLDALRSQSGDADIWLTGMPVLEWDESQSSQRDMQNATLLSLVGVAVIFVFGFGSWRMPCAAVVCLAIGLIWTVGLTTLCIGHLNLFSVAFGAIIAGLGIDYAIHLLTRLQTDGQGIGSDDLPQTLAAAVGHCGKGVLTGAVTTAAAFAAAMLTPFRGMTELGQICAMGTLACMAVTIWVLPALLAWQAAAWPTSRQGSSSTATEPSQTAAPSAHRGGWAAAFHASAIAWLSAVNALVERQRLLVLAGVSAATVCGALQVGRLHYDHNLLNLQADDVPSVHAERELTRRSGQSAWFAISLANSPQQALAMHQRLASLPSVARVEEVGSVIASAQMHPHTSGLVSNCRAHADQLVRQLAYQSTPPLAAAADGLVHTASHSVPVDAAADRDLISGLTAGPMGLAALQPNIAAQMQLLAESVSGMSAPQAPTLADFPAPVRERMASQDGQTFLLRVFARENLWQRENLGQFVRELESIDPRVTGHPIQTWYASGELENSYYQAGIYALLAVAALLMIDFGSVRLVLLAMVPVGLSALQLCGLMVWLDMPFNAANMIVLPLILGIGVDDGVHIVHDFHARRTGRYRISASTTLAVLLTSLTTMVGFGSMGIADHRGLQSLGIVLLLGVGLCLLNSWFTLPALLSTLGHRLALATADATAGSAANHHQAHSPLTGAGQSSQLACDGLECDPLEYDQLEYDPSESSEFAAGPLRAREPAAARGSGLLPLKDIPIVLSLPDYPEAIA
ncbi:MAG: MMPL family transporter [Aureliella sp.]